MERKDVEINEINDTSEILAELARLNALHAEIGLRVEQSAVAAFDDDGEELVNEKILKKIDEIADTIIGGYLGKPRPLLITLLDGALPFASKLQESLARKGFAFDFATIRTSSYDGDKSGKLKIISPPKVPVGGREVIVLDDVWDTGNTFAGVKSLLEELGALSIDLAAMVNKCQTREVSPRWLYSGFDMDKNSFIIGFGLDYAGNCRSMLDIKVVDPNSLMSIEESGLIARIRPLNERLQNLIALQNQSKKTTDSSISALHNLSLLNDQSKVGALPEISGQDFVGDLSDFVGKSFNTTS